MSLLTACSTTGTAVGRLEQPAWDAEAGVVHGGQGDCQLSNGESIDHVVVAPG